MIENPEEIFLTASDVGKIHQIKKNGYITIDLDVKNHDKAIWRHEIDGNFYYSKSIKTISENCCKVIYIIQILKEKSTLAFTLCNKLDLCKTIYDRIIFEVEAK